MKTEMELISSRSAELCAERFKEEDEGLKIEDGKGSESAGPSSILHPPPSTPWYCLRTHNKREHIAAAHLQKLPGVEVFNPQLRLMRCTRRGRFCNTEPLFPNYLFARFDLEQMLEKVNCTPAVKFVLRFGGKLPEIPHTVIADLQQQMAEVSSQVLTDAPVEGDEVEIAAGAFVGTKALVTHVLPAKQRVRILLDVMGRSVTTELSLDAVLFNRRNSAQLALRHSESASDGQPIILHASAPRLAQLAV
jgi:transcriptional antiterminator RfaH